MSIDTKKLRDTAEKMLSFGGWSKSRAHIAIAESEEWCSVQIDVRANRLAARKVAGYLKEVEPKTIVAMLDHIDAQAAEIAALRQPWQPIETAPKDGTEFDGWAGERVTGVFWGKPDDEPPNARGWVKAHYVTGYGWDVMRVNNLSHWMPLPAPPAALSGESNG